MARPKTCLSTSCFKNLPLARAAEECAALGPGRVELSAPHPRQPLDELAGELKALGLDLTLHNYCPPPETDFVLNIASRDREIRRLSRKLVREALELSKAVGAPLYGLHAGYLADARADDAGMFHFDDGPVDYAASLDAAVEFVNEAAPDFERAGVALLLENLFPTAKGDFSLFCTPAEIREFMARVPDSVGVLLDLGHLNVTAAARGLDRNAFLDEILKDFGPKIVEVHLSENNGITDQHLPVLGDSWQLAAIACINALPAPESGERVFCLESRAAAPAELEQSLDAIEAVLDGSASGQ